MPAISNTRAVLAGGTIGGALDLAFAVSFAAWHGMAPEHLLQVIASGLLGKAAFDGGPQAAALGAALHFLMSYAWAAIFALAAARVRVLAARPVPAGCLFGIAVFLAMRLVVKPLSAYPFPVTWNPQTGVPDLLSHMFLFGVPIALAAARARRAARLFGRRAWS